MYGDQFGEFVCGYWGLKGYVIFCHLCEKQQKCQFTVKLRKLSEHVKNFMNAAQPM